MLAGFKELKLNRARKLAFQQNFEEACSDYRKKGTKVDLKFANAFYYGRHDSIVGCWICGVSLSIDFQNAR
jgi:ABC-type siderophore export system fused ATPase/permease subunit